MFDEKNKPTLSKRIWERVDLEKLTIGKDALLRKYVRNERLFALLTSSIDIHIIKGV